MSLFRKSPPQQPVSEISAKFIELVMMQAQQALFFLGQIPDPRTGQGAVNIEMAKLYVDQLEIIEIKTRGNLEPEEQEAMKKALEAVRMAFLEVAGVGARESLSDLAEKKNSAATPPPIPQKTAAPPAAVTGEKPPVPTPSGAPPNPEENKKKYVKSYGNF